MKIEEHDKKIMIKGENYERNRRTKQTPQASLFSDEAVKERQRQKETKKELK